MAAREPASILRFAFCGLSGGVHDESILYLYEALKKAGAEPPLIPNRCARWDLPLCEDRYHMPSAGIWADETWDLGNWKIVSPEAYVAVHADIDKYMQFVNKAITFRNSNKITDDVLYEVSAPGPPWLTKIVYNYKKNEVRETYKRIAESPEVAEYVSQYASRVLSGEASKSIREYMDDYPEMNNYWGK